MIHGHHVSGQRPAAIVTPVAGTTRDVVELHVNIGGYPVIIADTAGLRTETSDEVEKEGILRAHAYAQKADLVILVIDAAKYVAQMDKMSSVYFDSYVNSYINELQLHSIATRNNTFESECLTGEKLLRTEGSAGNIVDEVCGSGKCIIVLNKTDLLQDVREVNHVLQHYNGIVALSCKTENGIPQLLDKITSNLKTL
jgi:tRNA modification GTPase